MEVASTNTAVETRNSEIAEVAFVNGNNFGFDEYFCFHINDFKVGDAVEYYSAPSVRSRGVVARASKRDLRVFIKMSGGEQTSIHINDVTYLSEPVKGWLSRKA